ncbi:MAG: hypothetical protein ACOCYV_00460 [Planctomycetota bacterium]
MNLDLLFYEPETVEPPTSSSQVEDALSAEVGMVFGRRQGAYLPFAWCDPASRARCTGDIGNPPLEEDTINPPTAYPGWRAVPLALHLPLATPHWHCVEALGLVARLLDRLPGLQVLNTEDTIGANDEPGPGPLDRTGVLATWEQLHYAQTADRSDLHRLDRAASLALWRYRRERHAASERHPELHWPEATVLLHADRARTAALWADPAADFALPPVELLVVRRDAETGLLPADELCAAASGGTPLELSAAIAIHSSPAVRALHAGSRLLNATRVRMLADGDWSD